MSSTDSCRLRPLQVVLLIIALIGAFLMGRCTGPGPPEGPVVEQDLPPVQPVEEQAPVPVVQTEPPEPEGIVLEPPPDMPRAPAEAEQAFNTAEQCWDTVPEAPCWCSCLPEPLPLVPSAMVPERAPEQGEQPGPEIPPGPETAEEAAPAPEIPLEVEQEPPPAKIPVEIGEELPEVFLGYDASVCAGDVVPAVQAIALGLEARAILYGVGPLSDCSGIFHRVLMGLKRRCPGHAYPPLEEYRDSRELARWYHEQGELILIKDPLQRTDLIRPGMVLFYGRGGTVYKDFTVDDLVATRAGIDHVGVVVSVIQDDDGEVTNYRLFHGHGRKGKNIASATDWHRRDPTKAIYPPFGNGLQQLVAAARIVRPMEKGAMDRAQHKRKSQVLAVPALEKDQVKDL